MKNGSSYSHDSTTIFNQAIINSVIYNIAIINHIGEIIKTNKAWDEFCISNGGNLEDCGVGSNYFNVTTPSILANLKDVLSGKKDQFSFEYPCHSPKEKRWFLMLVTPLVIEEEEVKIIGAVLSHINITDRKLLELEQAAELELAKSIQQSVLLPSILEKNITIEGLYLPSQQLSGDMYAWYKVDEDRFGVILLDIMGHGVSSSLISMSIRSLLQGIITRVTTPVDVYTELNKHFYSLFRTVNSPKLYYCTGIYMLINTKDQTIQYINAGHPSGLVLSDILPQSLDTRTVPIGIIEHPTINEETIRYHRQDRIILYTDGLSDSMKMASKEFDNYIFKEQQTKFKTLTLSDIVIYLENNITKIDDITIVSVQL
jgi:phosphoserine phosphatase RsbU/P